MGGKKKNNRDKPADKDDTKDSKKQQQKPVSRGGGKEEEEEGGSVPSPGGSPLGQHREEVTGRSHRTGSVPTVTYDIAQTVSGATRASSVSGRPKIVRGADKQEDKGGGDDLGTWGTFGGDHQDGNEEQDTASASGKKADGKRHRPAWMKKIASKPKKGRSLTDSASSLTRDVRHDPMHAVAESGLEIEPGEWEGSCEDEDTPIPKPKQNPEEQSQESPDLVLSPSSGQDSSVFSVGSSDYVVLERPSVFDKKDRQNSITELVENRERAIQDTEANEREKLQNIERIKQAIQDTEAKEREKQQNIGRIRKADENIIEAAAKYKKQVTNLQSQLDAERLKNEQLAKEKQEADDALIRVCSVAPGGVEKSVKEQHDSLRSENEKLADRAHTAEATVVQLTQGMKELTVESKACEEQLKTQHKSDLEAEKRQKTAMLKSKVESHDAGLAKKEAELQSLKEKLENEEAKTVVVTKMIEEKDAEILALQSQADANKEVKAVEYNCLQKQIDVAMKQVAQNAHSAKQLDDLKKRWSHEEVRYEKDLQSIKDVNEAALKEKDAQMAEAKEQWGAEFQDLIKQLESMSAEVEKYKQVSVEQKAAIELSKGDGGSASNYQSLTDVGLPSHVIRFAHEVAKFVEKEFTPPSEIPHTELHPERVERILDIIGTDPLAKQKSYAFAVLPADNKMHSVLLDFTGQLRMAEFQSLCALPPPGDIQGPPEAVASPQLTTENEDTNEPLPEEAEVVGEDLNKTDLQKTEGLRQKVDHLQKQLESSTAELTESQRSLKQAEDHVVKLTADLTAKTNEADELAALVITEKPGEALADQDELEKLRKLLQEKEAEIATLKTSLEHTADQQRKVSTGSHTQELDGETEKVSRLEGLLRAEKSSRKKAEGKIEALEEHLRKALSKTQPEQMNVSQQLLASQMQPLASDELSKEFRKREQQLEEEIESMKAAEADLVGTVRQLQAEVKAKNDLLQLTQSAQAGSEEDAFKKVKQEYVLKHTESIQLKEKLKQYESQHQPGALEVPICVRSLSHEEASASGLSSSAQIEQLKIAILMEKQKTGNLESTVRAFEPTAREHKRLKEHQTVQSTKILELIKELAEAKAAIAHLEEEQHALQGEMGAARDTVATTKTEVAQEKHSVQVQLEEVTAKAEQLQAELNDTKSKCYELQRKNEEMGKLYLKVQLGDAAAKSELLVAELAEWKSRCAKLEDDHTELADKLKQSEARVNDVLETIDQEFAGRVQSEEDEGKKAQLKLHSQMRDLSHTNSVLENDRRRLSQNLADMTKERDDFQQTVKAISDLLKEAEEEAEKQKRNYESRTRELSQKLKELDALRKRGAELAEELGVIKLEAATYKEDFETERREREEIASAMVEQKAKIELQYQNLKEEYDTNIQANIQVSERLEKEVLILEQQLEDKASQVEAAVKEKNFNDTKHQDEIKIATAKEDSLNDEIHNLTAKHQQLETKLKQQSDKLNGQIEHLDGELEVTCQHLTGARADITGLEDVLARARVDITGLEEELAGKTQQLKHYFKQVEDQKREIATLQSQGQDQQQQYEILWGEADNSKQRVTNLQGQLQKRLEEIEQLCQEIDRLHEEQQEYRNKDQRPAERQQDELARYRIMSYQPLSGDTFSGAGAFGSVHRVRVNNIPCIAKRIHDILVGRKGEEAVSDKQKHAIQLKFQQECILLSRMRHPNIVQFMGVHYPNQNPLDLTLIMEFLPMDLEKCLQKYPSLSLPIKVLILLDVSYGLRHLHNASIIHRDLSAANVLLTHDMRAKITDLGVSKIFQINTQQMTKNPGAHGYMPPEALWEEPHYTKKLDIFSMGVLMLYAGIHEYPEFYELKKHEPRDVQIKKRLKWIEMLPGKGCNCLHDLICQCLQDEAAHRPTTERLNIMLKQLSQDHPRQCTDIVHLEEELAQQKQEVTSLVKEKEDLKKQLIDAEVQKIPPVARYMYDTAPTPTAHPQYSEGYQQPPSTSYGASQYPSKRVLSKSTSVPESQGFHQYQRQYSPSQQGYQLQYQAGSTEGHHRAAAIREEYDSSPPAELPLDPNLVCPMCGLQFRIGEIQKYKCHVQKCKG